MSRSIVITALVLVTLAGCATQSQPTIEAPVDAAACTQLQSWLELQREVSAMTIGKVDQALANMGEPKGSHQQFYFGLLNQQLDAFAKWTEARDVFRQLAEDAELGEEQRSLAAVLERYNQSRINWYLQRRQLLTNNETMKAKLSAAIEDNAVLERKIQAITDLETSISTRKEQ